MGFPGDSAIKNPPANTGGTVQCLGQEDPLEEGMTTHSSLLARRIPWIEEPDGLQSTGSQRVKHDRVYTVMAGTRLSGRSEEDSTPSSHVTRADDSPGETQHSHHSWGSDQNRPEDSSLPSCSLLSPLSFLTDPLCQWLTASHGLLGKGVWLLSFKRDGSQNKLLFYAHTLLAIWTSSKL